MKKILFLMSMVVSLMIFTSCEKDKTAINMNETLLEVAVGDTCTLVANAVLTNKDGEFEVPIEWSSSDTSVVKIDKTTGFMSASKSDTVTITATANGTSKTREVIIYDFLCNKGTYQPNENNQLRIILNGNSNYYLNDTEAKNSFEIKFFTNRKLIDSISGNYNTLPPVTISGSEFTLNEVNDTTILFSISYIYNINIFKNGKINIYKDSDENYLINGYFIDDKEVKYTFKYSGQLNILNI